jgi:hypothetical protein
MSGRTIMPWRGAFHPPLIILFYLSSSAGCETAYARPPFRGSDAYLKAISHTMQPERDTLAVHRLLTSILPHVNLGPQRNDVVARARQVDLRSACENVALVMLQSLAHFFQPLGSIVDSVVNVARFVASKPADNALAEIGFV